MAKNTLDMDDINHISIAIINRLNYYQELSQYFKLADSEDPKWQTQTEESFHKANALAVEQINSIGSVLKKVGAFLSGKHGVKIEDLMDVVKKAEAAAQENNITSKEMNNSITEMIESEIEFVQTGKYSGFGKAF